MAAAPVIAFCWFDRPGGGDSLVRLLYGIAHWHEGPVRPQLASCERPGSIPLWRLAKGLAASLGQSCEEPGSMLWSFL
jgi:hypothetical protein